MFPTFFVWFLIFLVLFFLVIYFEISHYPSHQINLQEDTCSEVSSKLSFWLFIVVSLALCVKYASNTCGGSSYSALFGKVDLRFFDLSIERKGVSIFLYLLLCHDN